MHDRDEGELTATEREAFAALPRDAMPGRLLEERVVSELRARGLLGARRVRRVSAGRWRTGMAIAASFAIFMSGIAVGQWLGARQTAETMLAMQRQDAANAEATVQRTGQAYLAALGTLAQAAAATDPQAAARARAAAQDVLHQAANEMVRLAPDDPVSAHILQGLDRARADVVTTQPDHRKRLVWF